MSRASAQLNEKLAQCLTDFLLNDDTDVSVNDIHKFDKEGNSGLIYSFLGIFSSEGRKSSKEFILKVFKEEFVEKGRKEFALLNALKKQNLPVPTAYCFEEKCPILGKPIMIMERIVGKEASNYLNNENNAKFIVENMAKTLVKIHTVNLNYIETSKALLQEYKIKQHPIMETRFIISKRCMKFLGFSPPTQRRFIAAVKKLGFIEPKKVCPTLIHLDYCPDHILISNGQCIVLDWGDAIIGDPAYDVGSTYHTLRLERKNTTVDLGEYFVKCYEKYGGQKLVNLQFFKDNVAIELSKWSGLSSFNAHRFRNYEKLFSLFFGDIIGECNRARRVNYLQKNYARHHNSVLRNIRRIQSYALRYLERDRYETFSSPSP